jgi:ribosomal peptide maturation radical SAM protein 1
MQQPATPARERADVALVAMPWLLADSPSIQLGMLHAALAGAGRAVSSHSFHLAFLEFAAVVPGEPDALTVADYEALSTQWSNSGAPDWLFTGPPFGPEPAVAAADFERGLRRAGMPGPLSTKLRRLRARVPEFVAACAAEVLAAAPSVVGCTLVYSQTLSSLALARAIKAQAPAVQIVFGGACCDGPMGPALLRAYDVVDHVVRGEGELVLPWLVEALAAGDHERVRRLPGVCSRGSGRIHVTAPSPLQRPSLDALPRPDYDEYFDRVARGPFAGSLRPRLPYQSARGCWWGMKSHCRFCGLNGTDLEFRSRAAERVHGDLLALAQRHGVLDFTVVDNIMDRAYLTSLMPALAAGEHDLALFCETKANLRRDEVELLGRAGVRTVQPGIESLSTPVLRLMGKGVTALQNLRLLRWCAEAGMHVIWNLLYGFPREDPEDYRRMAELVPSLLHLPPPGFGPLMLARFSPYHEQPAQHGLQKGPPLPFYEQLYGAPPDVLADLAAVFTHAYDDGRDVECYVAPLRDEVERWRAHAEQNRGALCWRRGPGFLVITDARTTLPAPVRYELDADEAAVYLACANGATLDAIVDEVGLAGHRLDRATVAATLAQFAAARLCCAVDGQHLALALPLRRSWGRRPAPNGLENGVRHRSSARVG